MAPSAPASSSASVLPTMMALRSRSRFKSLTGSGKVTFLAIWSGMPISSGSKNGSGEMTVRPAKLTRLPIMFDRTRPVFFSIRFLMELAVSGYRRAFGSFMSEFTCSCNSTQVEMTSRFTAPDALEIEPVSLCDTSKMSVSIFVCMCTTTACAPSSSRTVRNCAAGTPSTLTKKRLMSGPSSSKRKQTPCEPGRKDDNVWSPTRMALPGALPPASSSSDMGSGVG
mmetsp:Transcript_10056/g.31859  ORF Transcript_10056/g.31859 Transcript_10056/m.31859 type:complete len:225 (-) Transcript_10056:1620-2294(-)